MLETQMLAAQRINAKYQQDRAKAEEMHKGDFLRTRLSELDAALKRDKDALYDEAAQESNRIRQNSTKVMKESRAKAVVARRATLGDQVYADLLRRQVESKDSAEIQRWFEEAAPGFERELVGMYGTMVVEGRINGEGVTGADFAALQALAQAEPDDLRQARETLRDIDNAEQRLGELDPAAYAVSVADRHGVNPQYMPTPA